ncbi:hypothetical protein [Xanthomonas arboricola]|uniref:hypothetical protein n=1 Tax=Xanthomonas arboricola TaxID=56448 RepID=UPI00187B8EE9|nr:hypothetical protein [Xanthomonas arboricola]
MTDYAAPKLTEMFVGVKPSAQRGGLRALPIIEARWRSPEIGDSCIARLARFWHVGEVSTTLHRLFHVDSWTR